MSIQVSVNPTQNSPCSWTFHRCSIIPLHFSNKSLTLSPFPSHISRRLFILTFFLRPLPISSLFYFTKSFILRYYLLVTYLHFVPCFSFFDLSFSCSCISLSSLVKLLSIKTPAFNFFSNHYFSLLLSIF